MWIEKPNKLLTQQCCAILSFLIIEELMANSTSFQLTSNNSEPIQKYGQEVIDGGETRTTNAMANSTSFQLNSTNSEPFQNYFYEVEPEGSYVGRINWNSRLPDYYSGQINYGGSSKNPPTSFIILIVTASLTVVALFFAFCKHFL